MQVRGLLIFRRLYNCIVIFVVVARDEDGPATQVTTVCSVVVTLSSPVDSVVRVWVANAVLADALHHPTVSTPVHGPQDHVVERGVVDGAVGLCLARSCVVRPELFAPGQDV
jgi:hypothetical protein